MLFCGEAKRISYDRHACYGSVFAVEGLEQLRRKLEKGSRASKEARYAFDRATNMEIYTVGSHSK